ncbi:hypothetical protein NKH77_15795 [Streptomyces sp. M19]
MTAARRRADRRRRRRRGPGAAAGWQRGAAAAHEHRGGPGPLPGGGTAGRGRRGRRPPRGTARCTPERGGCGRWGWPRPPRGRPTRCCSGC